MKLMAKGLLLAMLLLPAAPMAAHAFEGLGSPGCWPGRGGIHHAWRDIAHDRRALHWDLATHNWAAANWQWNDIRRDRRALEWSYTRVPGPYRGW